MSGDPRLTQAGDILEFMHREFGIFEQRNDAKPSGVGERPKELKCIMHEAKATFRC
jgi:hypothetical protein